MIVYGVCWQDRCEPWGWEPLSLWRDRDDAADELERVIKEELPSYIEHYNTFWKKTRPSIRHERAEKEVRDPHSIREYELR